jgi:hypothetical protein
MKALIPQVGLGIAVDGGGCTRVTEIVRGLCSIKALLRLY